MTLLSIIQSVAPRVGVPKPSAVIGSQDLQIQQLKAFADESGLHLMRYHDWQDLIVQISATADGTQIIPGTMPADYDRLINDSQIWNTSINTPIIKSGQRRWRFLLQYGGNAGVGGFYRILASQLNILPKVSSGDIIAFEYISQNWAADSGGTGQANFQADSDTTVFKEELMALEIIWRYRKAKGLAQYAEDMATAEREKEKIAAADRGGGTELYRDPRDDDPPPQPFWQGTIST